MIEKYSDDEIINFFRKQQLPTTNDISKAIYLLDNGVLISGEEIAGQGRTADHRIIEGLFNSNPYKNNRFWDEVLRNNNLIMLVPESKTAVIGEGQKINPTQKAVLTSHGYKVQC